jgi:hypothetical protein
MLIDQLTAAVTNAPSLTNHLADLSIQVWRAHQGGQLDYDHAQDLQQCIDAKRPKPGVSQVTGRWNNASAVNCGARSLLPKRRKQVSPDKAASIKRRQLYASRLCKWLPTELTQSFTPCRQSVLYVILLYVMRFGVCSAFIDEIAGRAGVCRTTVQNTLRQARALGLLQVFERRHAGQKSRTNLVRTFHPDLCRCLNRRAHRSTVQRARSSHSPTYLIPAYRGPHQNEHTSPRVG